MPAERPPPGHQKKGGKRCAETVTQGGGEKNIQFSVRGQGKEVQEGVVGAKGGIGGGGVKTSDLRSCNRSQIREKGGEGGGERERNTAHDTWRRGDREVDVRRRVGASVVNEQTKFAPGEEPNATAGLRKTCTSRAYCSICSKGDKQRLKYDPYLASQCWQRYIATPPAPDPPEAKTVRIIEKIVEKIVEIPVEKLVFVDKPSIAYLDKIVYQDRVIYKDKIIEKTVDRPVETVVYRDVHVHVCSVCTRTPPDRVVTCRECAPPPPQVVEQIVEREKIVVHEKIVDRVVEKIVYVKIKPEPRDAYVVRTGGG